MSKLDAANKCVYGGSLYPPGDITEGVYRRTILGIAQSFTENYIRSGQQTGNPQITIDWCVEAAERLVQKVGNLSP